MDADLARLFATETACQCFTVAMAALERFAEVDEQLGEQEKKFIGFLLIATVEDCDESLFPRFLQHFPASLFQFKF
jgi:hypothetical protein